MESTDAYERKLDELSEKLHVLDVAYHADRQAVQWCALCVAAAVITFAGYAWYQIPGKVTEEVDTRVEAEVESQLGTEVESQVDEVLGKETAQQITDAKQKILQYEQALDRLASLSEQPVTWQVPDLEGSWVNFESDDDGHYNPAGYYKDSMNRVHLRGFVKDGEGTILVLPEGFRPPNRELHAVVMSPNAIGRIDVLPTGEVALRETPDDGECWVSLDGISFGITP